MEALIAEPVALEDISSVSVADMGGLLVSSMVVVEGVEDAEGAEEVAMKCKQRLDA